jgi:hypothetical protein
MTTNEHELPGENVATHEPAAQPPVEPAPLPTSPPAPPAPRIRGAMSARVGAEDQTARQRSADDAATHATATGKRRDLLAYLRLRRRNP